MAPSNEPVSIAGVINSTAALVVAFLLYLKVDPQVVAAVSVALSGWLATIAAVVRTKVTPTHRVAMTKVQADELRIAQVLDPLVNHKS